ncbi:sulfotransferase family 2 domain-containing protein [Rhizobium sp.]
MRPVILHYHLFKNAGTSVDELLEYNFRGKCLHREFSEDNDDNSRDIAEWIRSNPSAVSFSTHTGRGPVPSIDGVRILPIMFFRDPIERLLSAYRFERVQDADTFGAQAAKEGDFGHYVKKQLDVEGNRQCRNFQTHRLASLRPGPEPEIVRAFAAINDLALAGFVPQFERCFSAFKSLVRPVFPNFLERNIRANATTGERADTVDELDNSIRDLLVAHNQDDLRLLKLVISKIG